MRRTGWALVVVAVVLVAAGIGVWRLLTAPTELRTLPDLCELASTSDVQALVPDADAVFTGDDGPPSPGTASCNVQRTDAATAASLFVFASQSPYGAPDDDEVRDECERIGASPSDDGPGEQMCLVSTPSNPGQRTRAIVFDGEYLVRVDVIGVTDDGADDDERQVEGVLQDVLDRLPRA